MDLVDRFGNLKEFLLKPSKLYKEAKFNYQANFGLIREAIRSDQGLLQFAFLRKADAYEQVRGNCDEYADNKTVFVLMVQEEQVIEQAQANQTDNGKKKF